MCILQSIEPLNHRSKYVIFTSSTIHFFICKCALVLLDVHLLFPILPFESNGRWQGKMLNIKRQADKDGAMLLDVHWFYSQKRLFKLSLEWMRGRHP